RPAELVGLVLEPRGERAGAPDLARERGHAQLRVVDVALHLAGRDRRGGERPVVEALRVARVFPGLVLEPARSSALVLDEAVAVAVAVLVDPGERPHGRVPQLANKFRVVRPAPDLRELD